MDQTRTGAPAVFDLLRIRRASAYGGGRGIDQAVEVCRRLASYGIASALGYSAWPDESARAAADVQLTAFDRLQAAGLDCYVSVKLAGLGFDAHLFAELARAAACSGLRLHADALGPELADATMTLFEGAPRPAPMGTTLPGRWRRSPEDARRAMELGLKLRSVTGQWDDPLGGSVDPKRGFLDVVDRVCGYQGGVAVATHNVPVVRESLRRLTASGTPCESELYLGMPFDGPARVAREYGVPLRVYVAYGNAWPDYGLRDLLTHPATVRWLAQDLLWGRNKSWRSISRSRTR